MSLTHRLREELARSEATAGTLADAEVAACLRYGGVWSRRGGAPPGWVLETPVAALVRRVRSQLARSDEVRTELEVRRPGELAHEARYRLRIEGAGVLEALGLLGPGGEPSDAVPRRREHRGAARAYLRGALMAAGQLSGAGRAPHLEVRAPSEASATDLVGVAEQLGLGRLRATSRGDQWRVVAKSGERIGAILAAAGAHQTFLSYDEGRLRRQLRDDANRAANADRANLSRTVVASSRQVRTIEGLLVRTPLEELPGPLREAALVRLANPDASLSELSRLLETGKATVHRRLARLEFLAAEAEERR